MFLFVPRRCFLPLVPFAEAIQGRAWCHKTFVLQAPDDDARGNADFSSEPLDRRSIELALPHELAILRRRNEGLGRKGIRLFFLNPQLR